ncbi:MAG: transcription termination factor NusA [Eubacteriales bacterium]|jgi:N utilization substance protein A
MRAKKKTEPQENMVEVLSILEKEKGISKDTLLEAIKQSLLQAYKNQYDRQDNVVVDIDEDTCVPHIYQLRKVVENVEDPTGEIAKDAALQYNSQADIGDTIRIELDSKKFGRIAASNAKNVILQKIREEERNSLYNEYAEKQGHVITGVVQRYIGNNVSINLGKADALLTAKEMVRGESFKPTDRVKVYVTEVKNTPKGPKILVSRTHPNLVKCLFEEEVAEIQNGIIEIKAIAREAGSRTKIAVWSNDENVDAVGACVGVNGSRVNTIVDELDGEKIDIINWDENEAYLIENALSPAKVISVLADPDEKTAIVVVPDYQLSLAIGKEGQNARLAAHLTNYKIDIKSETQAREAGLFDEYDENGEYIEDEDSADDAASDEDAAPAEDAASDEDAAPAEDAASEEDAASADEDTPEEETAEEDPEEAPDDDEENS